MNQLEDFSEYNGEGTVLRKAQLRLLEMLIEFDKICTKHNIPYFISGGTCLGAVRHGGFIPWDDDIDIDIWYKDYKKLEKILVNELPQNYFIQTYKTDRNFHAKFMRIVDKNSSLKFKNNRLRKNIVFKGLFIDVLPLNHSLSYSFKIFIDKFIGAVFRINRTGHKNFLVYMCAKILVPIGYVFLKINEFFSFLAGHLNPEKITHHHPSRAIKIPKLLYSECFPPQKITFEGKSFLGPAKPHEYLISLYGKNYMQIPSRDKRVFHAEHIEIE
ncbi:LicD family protein [Acinetobacter sp. F9]|uniref:LicD family protein n=1 Tax=Acinetobacter sp. F9 TaxID=2853158 RepID=UPI001C47494C|nr:LicD family protein [Acinetobacter sp. F9]